MLPAEPAFAHLRADRQPRLSTRQAEAVLLDLYGLRGGASPLPSDRDQNFKLQCGAEGAYVLKIFHPDEDAVLVQAQASLFALLNGGVRPVFPTLRPTLQGRPFTMLPAAHGKHGANLVWLAHFVPGEAAAVTKRLTPALLHDIGGLLGAMDSVLAANPQPAAQRPLLWAAHTAPQVIGARVGGLPAGRRRLVEQVLAEFQANVGPLLPGLRRSLIHNDVNDHNLLLDDQRVGAILDFGDMVESYTICELAHAAAYLLLDRPDPLAIAAQLTSGYVAAYPLRAVELRALYDFVRLRLALSVTLSAYQQALRPDDPYLGVSEAPAWRLLRRLTTGDVTRRQFTAAIMQAGGTP